MSVPATIAPQISIRKAEARDAEAIARLAGELGYASTAEQGAVRLAAIADDPQHAVFVAEARGGELIGWIHIRESRTLEADVHGEIMGLVVDAQHRSAGAGRLLVERGEQWARERGLKIMSVRSNVIRDRAHEFYLRQGYAVVKWQKAFRKNL